MQPDMEPHQDVFPIGTGQMEDPCRPDPSPGRKKGRHMFRQRQTADGEQGHHNAQQQINDQAHTAERIVSSLDYRVVVIRAPLQGLCATL